MNHSMIEIGIAALAGFALGIAYFATLWFAVRHAMKTQSIGVVGGTALLRLGALLAGIWCVTQAEWQLVLPCLMAMLIGRQCVVFATSRFVQETTL